MIIEISGITRLWVAIVVLIFVLVSVISVGIVLLLLGRRASIASVIMVLTEVSVRVALTVGRVGSSVLAERTVLG